VVTPSQPETQLLNTMNCARNPKLRRGIYLREEGRCFYCREEVRLQDAVLDHVVPVFEGGDHTYRNVVLSCFRCNASKAARSAKDFLHSLKDRGIISIGDVHSRMLAIRELQAGRLRPVLRAA
jgi:5-methylcytosine-specific restriction endonuclease McrA